MILKKNKKIDFLVLSLVIGFVLFGLVMIGDISLNQAQQLFGDQFYFVKHQTVYALFGIVVLTLLANIKYSLWEKLSKPLFIISIVSLVLVFLPGIGISSHGASRWINLGIINFQPIEFVKLTAIIYFAKILSQKEKPELLKQIFLLSIPVIPILLEPDLSSAILLIFTIVSLWFFNREKFWFFLILGLIGIVLGSFLILGSSYRKQRVLSMFNPFYDPQDQSYHAYQLALTLGSGGLFGQGMGNSHQKYQYLPEASTDSILALVAEEFGLIGITILMLAFLLLIIRLFYISLLAPDKFSQLTGLGISSLIGIQGLVNLGAISISLPLTGIPFPFVSYGGTSLIVLLALIGILLNISKS